MDTQTARKLVSLSILVASAGLFGCKNANDADYPAVGANGNFRPDDEPRALDDILAAQSANGAREDGTLYPAHFTDGKLNSLGYQKLSAMAYGPETGKLAIYLNVPKGEQYAACEDSVTKALNRGGYQGDRFTITAGGNPNVSAPAAQGLAGLGRLHGGTGPGDSAASPNAGTIDPTTTGH